MTSIQPPMEHFERPDPVLTNKIVTHLKSHGIFDQFRRECMADVDTKPAYHNLRQRVEGSVAAFLRLNPWRPDMNKNQLRDNLRKHIQSGGFLDIGVDRIVDQVVNPKIYSVFLPKVEEVVQSCIGTENDKPKFDPPPSTEVKSELPKFQDKHNLAPRAKLPAPLLGPMMKSLKPPDLLEGRLSPVGETTVDNEGDTDTEEAADKKYVVDDDLDDKDEDEDDEESPPFEPHSEGDRLILGMRSDTSENSNDSQVVTTIVDDNLEERIDNNEMTIKEESDKKDDDSSSDEYVPKTPTINMEESDGSVLEFSSISEYKQIQTKFEDESFGNIEEVVSSHCINDSHGPVKEERSSNEEDSVNGSQKRKYNIDSYDDASSSSDKESTSDEIKPAVFKSLTKKRFKLEEYDQRNETSELFVNDTEIEDSQIERSPDMTDSKMKIFDNDLNGKHIASSDYEHHDKHPTSSTSSKDSEKSSYYFHTEYKDIANPHGYKDQTAEKDYQEKTRTSHSSKDKKDTPKKSDKHESTRDRHKERDSKHRSESSSKHSDKEREKDKGKKRTRSPERTKKDMEDADKSRKESRHEQKDHHHHHHESKSRDHHDKEKKKHSSRDRHSDGKEDHDSTHKSDKHRRDDSKHHASNSRHGHRSSSEKHKSDKDRKHRGERHKSHDKKSDKDTKEESRKKYRQHCKYTNDKDENRRSSDRDSSGPSARTHMASSSKSTSSRTYTESKVDTGERTTSNSDNTVSDNIEILQNDSKFHSINERGIASPDKELVGETLNEPDVTGSDWNSSKEDQEQHTFESEDDTLGIVDKAQDRKIKCSEYLEGNMKILATSSNQPLPLNSENQIDLEADGFIHSNEMSNADANTKMGYKPDFVIPSVSLHDSSSEKENIEQIKEQFNNELDDNMTDTSLEEDTTAVKFKKPKIAKNIHEVRKIMEARRHIKRMEKKRIKLLLKNKPEEHGLDEKSPSEDRLEDESQEEFFRGFEDNFSLEKTKKYASLTERLENEASQLEKLINYEQINSNLITSWIDLDHDLDDYIENTLKGKVHRRYRVRIPPICDEYYKYDSELNVFFLVKDWDVTEVKELMVDSNLNNLNSVRTTDEQDNSICNEIKSKRRKLREDSLPCTNIKVMYEGCDNAKQNSSGDKIIHNKTKSEIEAVNLQEENIVSSNASPHKITKNDSKKIGNSSDVIASPNFMFSLTFNQTYDEVLKEKAQNPVVPSKKEVGEMSKTPLTVVKITNNKTSEQVFMKQFQTNSEGKGQGHVPRITKSETIANGKIIETSMETKQVPLISRIKSKNALTPLTTMVKSQSVNSIASPTSATNFEDGFSRGVPQKIITHVINMPNAVTDQGTISDQSSQSSEESSEPRRRRATGCRQQQRYDSSDLYKPRLQLSSRRVRGVGSSPEETSPVPQVVVTRKRSATADLGTGTGKRRR